MRNNKNDDINAGLALDQFHGSMTRYRHHYMLLSPGALHIANTYHAWWLIDMVSAQQLGPPVAAMKFQVWQLRRRDNDGMSEVTCSTGSRRIRWRQSLHSDFPRPGVELWVVDLTIFLPQEN